MERTGAILPYLGDARSILLGFAILNFSTTWINDSTIQFTCAACPWHHPWSHLNEPTVLLVASVFLRTDRWWGNTVALLATGYLGGYFVHLMLGFQDPVMTLVNGWKLSRREYPFFVGSWESQYLCVLIVLSCSVVSLSRNLRRQPKL